MSPVATRGRAWEHPGGIVDKELTIHISNVAHLDPSSNQPDTRRLQSAQTAAARSASPAARAKCSTSEVVEMARLQGRYSETVHPALMKEFGYQNRMQVPRVEDRRRQHGGRRGGCKFKRSTPRSKNLKAITGQAPVVGCGQKSIATFKLRENMPIGVKVTLRRAQMYEFLDRLINVALPRVRDFRGVSGRSFDEPRQLCARAARAARLLQRSITTRSIANAKHGHRHRHKCKTDAEARALLKAFDMPFAN